MKYLLLLILLVGCEEKEVIKYIETQPKPLEGTIYTHWNKDAVNIYLGTLKFGANNGVEIYYTSIDLKCEYYVEISGDKNEGLIDFIEMQSYSKQGGVNICKSHLKSYTYKVDGGDLELCSTFACQYYQEKL